MVIHGLWSLRPLTSGPEFLSPTGIASHTGCTLPSLPHFPESPLPTKTCNSFPCLSPLSAQPTAPLPVQNQTQGLPGTVAVSMNSVGRGSNPTATILRATHIRSLGSRLMPCSSSWPAPGMTPQGGLPGVLWPHLSLLTHHRYGQTIDKPCQSSFAKEPGSGSRWSREPWSPSSKTLAQKSCLLGASSSMLQGEVPP